MLKNYYREDSLYTELHEGDSFEIEPNATMNLACCDCNLVHKLIFKIMDNGNISMKLKRNSRETAKKRKADLSRFIIGMSAHFHNKKLDAKTIYINSNMTNSDVDHILWEKLEK